MNIKILKITILILSISIFMSACSSKNPSVETNKENQANIEMSLDDEFEDEFEITNKKIFDPLEGYNRWMTSINDKVYTYAFNPLSEAYAFIIPKPARLGVSNAFHNLRFPIRFTNNLLQLKFDSSMKELGRFMINSSLGVLGLFDVAKMGGIEPQEEDFGQTLGYYGVGSGFHVVLPFLGPSNLRDTIGFSLGATIDPITYGSLTYQIPNNVDTALALFGTDQINRNSLHLGEYENFKKDALDVYTFFRDSYEQKRANDIKN